MIYKCKDNDVQLDTQEKDGKIDEIWVGVEGLPGWTIVGYDDLNEAIKLKRVSIERNRK